jgi:hypothetical protein
MGLKELSYVGAAVIFDVMSSLGDIDAIETVSEAKICEGIGGFSREAKFATNTGINFLGNGLIGAGEYKVINLSTEKDLGALISQDVDILFMSRRLEI